MTGADLCMCDDILTVQNGMDPLLNPQLAFFPLCQHTSMYFMAVSHHTQAKVLRQGFSIPAFNWFVFFPSDLVLVRTSAEYFNTQSTSAGEEHTFSQPKIA